MFNKLKKKKNEMPHTWIDTEIDRIREQMQDISPTDSDYVVLEGRLCQLYELKGKEFDTNKKVKEKKPLVPKEVQGPLVSGLFMVGGIVLTKLVEFDGPITTKGWSLIPKGRV